MKLYLSSFKLGNESQRLREIIGVGQKIAIIPNALDFSKDQVRKDKTLQDEIESLKAIDLSPEVLDLQGYFGHSEQLKSALFEYCGVWIIGGNVFVLRKAMALSGFDQLIHNMNPHFVYAGYSAGPCAASPSLKGLELIDRPEMVQQTYDEELDWTGLGLIDFMFVPHYKSDHPESDVVDDLVVYLEKEAISFKTFIDGEVFIVD